MSGLTAKYVSMAITEAQAAQEFMETCEYRTISADYNAIEGDGALYEMVVGSKKYKAEVDENGNPIRLSRYSDEFGLWVEISFNGGIDNEVSEKVCETLKSLYIQRFLDLKTLGEHGTMHNN